jgi:hypothetical protein
MPRLLAAALWSLAAAFAVCAFWIVGAQSGMVSAWVILPFFWSAAVLAVLGRYLAQTGASMAHYLAQRFVRYLARSRPLGGSGARAGLPS